MASIFPPNLPSPHLPVFKSLLIQGPYHPSAPLHLCLSHIANTSSSALLITPSRAKLQTALKEFNDDWLNEHGGDGLTRRSATRVQILYPPTATHLSLVLTALHEINSGGKSNYIPNVTFDFAPSLIVFCDLSSYLTNNPASTVSSYLMLVSQALTSVASLSTKSGSCTSLAVLDSGLDNLRLPLVCPPSPTFLVKKEDEDDTVQMRHESVPFLASKFFEWVGALHAVEAQPTDGHNPELEERTRLCELRLRGNHSNEEIKWHWVERSRRLLDQNGCGTSFEWP